MKKNNYKGNVKKYICFCIFLFVNTLFGIKYISRYSELYIPCTLLVVFFLTLLILQGSYLKNTGKNRLYALSGIVLFSYLIFSIFLFNKIQVETLNVDRWSVITSFWETFEKGEYAYSARSDAGNPPGPMPFYFILAYPFYRIGELGWYSLLGLPVFALVFLYNRAKSYLVTIVLLLLAFSPFVWWEILCRSNILLNGSLVLFSIVYFLNGNKLDNKRLIISGILFGLFLSTRSVFVIAYIITCIYALRSGYMQLRQIILMACLSLVAFSATFLPFVYSHPDGFLSLNPFFIQSTFLMPFGGTLFFVFLAFLFGCICRKQEDIYICIALNLFLCIFGYFIFDSIRIGLYDAVFGRITDISYFIFCIPFALYCCLFDSAVE